MDKMLGLTQEHQVVWKTDTVQAYFSKIDQFLEQMLLLIHTTSEQPARGIELLSLQHSNTAQGHHRSIFVEEGLISTVTSYHKGYNITGTTKIITNISQRRSASCLCTIFGSFFRFRRSLFCWCISAWLRLPLFYGRRRMRAERQTGSQQRYARRIEPTSTFH